MDIAQLSAFEAQCQALLHQEEGKAPVVLGLQNQRLQQKASRFLGRYQEHVCDPSVPMPFVIGVAGGSASGKTVLTKLWKEAFEACNPANQLLVGEEQRAPIVSTWRLDNYYYDQAELRKELGDDGFYKTINVDTPHAYELTLFEKHIQRLKQGYSVRIPFYNMAISGRVDGVILKEPTPFVIVEGLFTMWDPNLRELFDMTLYVDTPEDTRVERNLKRAMQRSGIPESYARKMFEHVTEMHNQHIEPTKPHADITMNGTAALDDTQQQLQQLANLLIETFHPQPQPGHAPCEKTFCQIQRQQPTALSV